MKVYQQYEESETKQQKGGPISMVISLLLLLLLLLLLPACEAKIIEAGGLKHLLVALERFQEVKRGEGGLKRWN